MGDEPTMEDVARLGDRLDRARRIVPRQAARNDISLTCEDFEVSGNFVPTKCVREYKEPAGALGGAPVPLHRIFANAGESV